MVDAHLPSAEVYQTKALQVQDADRCVMCGLCLPHCPTYQLFQQEGDSPRGRILLIKALANNDIPLNEKAVQHLDGCLMCRRCETVCPTQVPFGRLLNHTKHEISVWATKQRYAVSTAQLPAWLSVFAQRRVVRYLSAAMLRIYQYSGLRTLLQAVRLRRLSKLAAFDQMLPPRMPRLIMRTRGKFNRSDVALFIGCTGKVFDSETLTTAQRLLASIGFRAVVPRRQNCCGAMHQHTGDQQTAAALLRQNSVAFRQTPVVISCATGCGMQLNEHAKQLGICHDDIHSFLLRQREAFSFRECDDTVTVHTPCTMHNDDMKKLLALVPGLNVRLLTAAGTCCGGAGAYMLTHLRTAQTLLKPFLDMLDQQQARTLLTSNIGCALHFRRGLAMRQMAVEVMHPVVWLDKNAVISRKQPCNDRSVT